MSYCNIVTLQCRCGCVTEGTQCSGALAGQWHLLPGHVRCRYSCDLDNIKNHVHLLTIVLAVAFELENRTSSDLHAYKKKATEESKIELVGMRWLSPMSATSDGDRYLSLGRI